MAETKAGFEVRPGGMGPMGRFEKKAEKLKNPKETLRRLLSYMEGDRMQLVLTFLICMMTALIGIAGTRLNGYAVDEGIRSGDMAVLLRICLTLATVYLIGVFATYFQNRMMVRIAQKTSSQIRDDLYGSMQLLPVRYFDVHSGGDLLSRLTNDVDNINMTLSQNMTQFFTGVVNIAGMLIAMLLLSPTLLMAGLVTLPLMLLSTKQLVRHTQPYFIRQQKELGQINGYIEERISGQKVTLLFGQEEQARQAFREMNEKLMKSSVKAQAFSGVLGPMNNLINNLTYFVVACTGAYLILMGSGITVGIVFTFILYMRGFIQPINQILNTFNMIQSALAGAERVFEVMDEPKEHEADVPQRQEPLRGDVVFNRVDFSYVGDKHILKEVTLKARKGQTIAIVGPTGSGKTTIMNILTRFYDIDGGEILIDGEHISTLEKRFLRRNIAMVLQDTFLFSESVRENIRYARLTATDEEVEQAARIANAHRFIQQLPEGYDTVLSENGSSLSHGQKQLLAIARAVLAESSILILDEATSSIDTRTELAIQNAMLKLMAGKTTFIIAHRLSTIRHADMILALDDGRIIEQGSHESLIEQGGFYADLCNSQYKGIAI